MGANVWMAIHKYSTGSPLFTQRFCPEILALVKVGEAFKFGPFDSLAGVSCFRSHVVDSHSSILRLNILLIKVKKRFKVWDLASSSKETKVSAVLALPTSERIITVGSLRDRAY